MSGYLSDLVSEVETRDDTTLVQMDDADAQEDTEWADDEPPIAVDEIVSFFRRKGLGNRDYVVIPAHEPDEPTFNGDIITYRTTDYGAAFYYDNGISASGYVEFDNFSRSTLARRIRLLGSEIRTSRWRIRGFDR